MNEPVIWAMDVLAHDPRFTGKYDKFITLSGDSLPTLTNSAMADLFSEHLMPYNILTSFWSETGFTPTKYNEYPKHWHKRNAYRHPIGVAYKEVSWGMGVGVTRSDVTTTRMQSYLNLLSPNSNPRRYSTRLAGKS